MFTLDFSCEWPCRWSMTWPIEMLIFCENSLSLRCWCTTLGTWTEANLEQLDLKKMDVCYLSQFLKGFFFRTRENKTMVPMPYLSRFRRKEFSLEIRKFCFLQNSLELHQPDMHIDYRVIPISVHILSLARISGFRPTILQQFFCCRLLRWWVRFRLRFLVYNQHVIACGTCKGWGLHEE